MSIQKAVLKAGLKRRKQFNTISSHGVADKKKKATSPLSHSPLKWQLILLKLFKSL